MHRRSFVRSAAPTVVVILIVFTAGAHPALAGTFSIGPTAGSVFGSATGFFDDDLLAPGPVAGLQAIGAGVPSVNVNAVTFGHTGITSLAAIAGVEFSVAHGSFGVAGTALAAQVAAGEAGADIFHTALGGSNTLLLDGDAAGPGPIAPPMGVFEPTTPPPPLARPDDVDAWDTRLLPPAGSPVYFSIDSTTGTSDAVFVGPAGAGYDTGGVFYAGVVPLGLSVFPGVNDIDGLVVVDNDGLPLTFTPGVDLVFFSLTVGSVALAPSGATAGDILVDPAGAALLGIAAPPGLPGIAFTEASMGIATALSELDGFDFLIVPEPSAVVLALVGFVGLLVLRRRC